MFHVTQNNKYFVAKGSRKRNNIKLILPLKVVRSDTAQYFSLTVITTKSGKIKSIIT